MASRNNIAYQQIKVGDIPKSGFDLSNKTKISGKIARLIPSVIEPICLPSDRYKVKNSAAFQFEPLAVPLVSDMKMSLHNFFVPFRIIDSNFEKVMNGDTKVPTQAVVPHMSLKGRFEDILDYMSDATPLPSLLSHFVSKAGIPVFGGAMSFNWDLAFDITSSDWQTVWSSRLNELMLTDTYRPWFKQLADYKNSLPELREVSRVISDGLYFGAFGDGDGDMLVATSEAFDVLLDRVRVYYYTYCDFLFGEGSLLDFLHYYIITHDIIDKYVDTLKSRLFVGDVDRLNGEFELAEEFYDYLHELDTTDSMKFYVIGRSDQADYGSISFDNFLDSGLVSELTEWEYPLRAYYRIWYDYYRDINLEKNAVDPATFGANPLSSLFLLPLRIRCWSKDLFTTAMIDDPSYHVIAPIYSGDDVRVSYLSDNQSQLSQTPEDTITDIELRYHDQNGQEKSVVTPTLSRLRGFIDRDSIDDENNFYRLDLALFKRCQHLQDFLRRDFFFGSLYRDQIEAHFGIKSKDARLQFSEMLSGSDTYVSLSTQVNNTTTEQMDAGEKTAVAYGAPDGDGYTYFCDEHGILINLLSLIPEAQYNAHPKQMSVLKRLDFAFPEFANEGAEIMLANELSRNITDIKPFGYQPRYYEYRTRVDTVHGQLLSSKRGYTFLRDWTTTPNLNYEFIHCHPDLSMFYTNDELTDLFFGDFRHDIYAEKPLPRYVDMF